MSVHKVKTPSGQTIKVKTGRDSRFDADNQFVAENWLTSLCKKCANEGEGASGCIILNSVEVANLLSGDKNECEYYTPAD